MTRKSDVKIQKIKELSFEFPENLEKYLNKTNLILFKSFLANYNIQEICACTNLTRKEILNQFIELGKSLLAYNLLETKIFPKSVPSADYLIGWNDCKKQVRRISNESNIRGKTIESRNSSEKRKN